jgi:SAM-dependent methyltransferase
MKLFNSIPLRPGTPEEFHALREAFAELHFTELSACERLGLGPLQGFRSRRDGRATALDFNDALDVLIRLFLDGEYVAAALVESFLPASLRGLLAKAGLLGEGEKGAYYAPVALYPTESLYIVSDRFNNPDGSPFTTPADIVYPAITDATKDFLSLLPEDRCESFLDVGTGTGVAALAAARRCAAQAWAVDITERSVRFAEFNRLLNGAENVTVLASDLYSALGDRTFDRIVAHPPYVPAARQQVVFRDGGEDGEQITRRIVEGLPRYLRPGGRFYGRALATDRKDQPLEQRIRDWLGERGEEFDVLLIGTFTDRLDAAVNAVLKSPEGVEGVQQWRTLFEQLGVTAVFLGGIVIQRHDRERPAFTARRMDRKIRTREIEWLRRWETAASEAGTAEWLLGTKPTASPNLQLLVRHRIREGKLTPQSYNLDIDAPFPLECHVEPWMVALLSRADGTRTCGELVGELKERGLCPADMPAAQAAPTLRAMMAGGFLEIDGFRPPRAAESEAPTEG